MNRNTVPHYHKSSGFGTRNVSLSCGGPRSRGPRGVGRAGSSRGLGMRGGSVPDSLQRLQRPRSTLASAPCTPASLTDPPPPMRTLGRCWPPQIIQAVAHVASLISSPSAMGGDTVSLGTRTVYIGGGITLPNISLTGKNHLGNVCGYFSI